MKSCQRNVFHGTGFSSDSRPFWTPSPREVRRPGVAGGEDEWPDLCSRLLARYPRRAKRGTLPSGCDRQRRPTSEAWQAAVMRTDMSHQLGGRHLYIGPDTLMPLASVFAAVAGFVLMFWRRLIGAVKLLVDKLSGRSARR
jgi:hypothetical protein